jgi:hypothetical protein
MLKIASPSTTDVHLIVLNDVALWLSALYVSP